MWIWISHVEMENLVWSWWKISISKNALGQTPPFLFVNKGKMVFWRALIFSKTLSLPLLAQHTHTSLSIPSSSSPITPLCLICPATQVFWQNPPFVGHLPHHRNLRFKVRIEIFLSLLCSSSFLNLWVSWWAKFDIWLTGHVSKPSSINFKTFGTWSWEKSLEKCWFW